MPLKPSEGSRCILRRQEVLGNDYSYIQTCKKSNPEPPSIRGFLCRCRVSGRRVIGQHLVYASLPLFQADYWGSQYWSEPWMGALDLHLHLRTIKEAPLQSNVFHRVARGGCGHLHFVSVFRLGAEADTASQAALSLDPLTLTITEKKVTEKHIRFHLIYGLWWHEYSSRSNLDITRLNWCKALMELIHAV